MSQETRLKIFRWVLFNLFKYDDSKLLNKWAILLRFLLLPIDTFLYFATDRRGYYDLLTDSYNIEGVKFNRGFLRTLKVGESFQVVNKEGNLWLIRLSSNDDIEAARKMAEWFTRIKEKEINENIRHLP